MAIGSTLTPVGISTDKHYKHTQYSSETEWLITHGLDKIPSIVCYDTAGNTIYATIETVNNNTTKIKFGFPIKGTAILN